MWWSYKPYVSVARRRADALEEVAKLAKKGRVITPVKLDGRKIARTFWGNAWCDHLESFSDYANRLPRGRSYVRNGSVVDLQIAAGQVTALVSGSELYEVQIKIKPLASKLWQGICCQCAGKIGTMVELLQGKLSDGVMQIVTCRETGLFPSPREIEMDCSCPDWAGMCKHVAAVLYGVGARFDAQPELLFKLRDVDHLELIAKAGDVGTLTKAGSRDKTIAAGDLAEVFGIELDAGTPSPASSVAASSGPMVEESNPTGADRVAVEVPGRSTRRKAVGARPASSRTKGETARSKGQKPSKMKAPASKPAGRGGKVKPRT